MESNLLHWPSQLRLPNRLRAAKVFKDLCLYKQGKLGGGEGIEGLYGSITRSGMQKILDCLVTSSRLTQTSHVVDVGAGLGRFTLVPILQTSTPML